jgi:predicted dinucleotide-binding enzyme
VSEVQTIGIIGAGKLGIVLGQLATRAGYTVYISGSDGPEKIKLTINVLVPTAVPVMTSDAVKLADVVILALPLSNFRELPRDVFAGKLVIDAMNYWWEVDGRREAFLDPNTSSSEAVQEFFADARVVKALSHMGYHDLHDESRPMGSSDRKAIAIAGDAKHDIEIVTTIINNIGFDPVYIGPLSEGKRLEPGSNLFGANVDKETLRRLLDEN